MSTTVGVRELKNRLSRYLRVIAGGESVIVCDRGEPVAILSPIPEGVAASTTAAHLASLASRGLVALGTPRKRRKPRRRVRADLSGAVAEDRAERS